MMERDGVNRRRGERRVGSTPAPASRIRVLVVEDNRLMRDGLARLLAAFPDVEIVASAENANAGAAALREARPQVVLLDAALANGDSHTFLSNLKSAAPDAKAVVIDFVPAQQDVQQFIERGANGFIMKDATAEDIVKAIRSVASGTDLPPPPAPPRAAADGDRVSGGYAATGDGGMSNVRLTKR
jgi:DNA-binding NarL/FixJ family response regulator